jgi:type IV secretion system protein VirB1
MIVPIALFTQLAASCAPSVHVDTLAAIASTESRFHAGAIYDNTTKRQYLAPTRQAATALATDLHATLHHSVDLGLMQINSANLPRLGMTVADAFDPCKNLGAASAILAAAYRPPVPGNDTRAALLQAISRYNTGHPSRGFSNGYVGRVLAAADKVVPTIYPQAIVPDRSDETRTPVALPSWDVFALARHARGEGSRGTMVLSIVKTQHLPQPHHGAPLVFQHVTREANDAR